MRSEAEIRDELSQLLKIYKNQGSVEVYRHPETYAMVKAIEWVLGEIMVLPHYPEDF